MKRTAAKPRHSLIYQPPLLVDLRAAGAVERGSSQLLEQDFDSWCKGLQIKSSRGLQPFTLFDWQSRFTEVLLNNPRTPITLLSSRQTGKTAEVLALLIWLALSRFEFTAVVIHRKGDDSKQLARRAKRFIPAGVRLGTCNLSLIEFADTGSQLHFRSCNPRNEDGAEAVGRGLNSVDLIVIEEASHTGNVKEILGVLAPALTWSNMATVLQIGTAGRKETYFYQSLVDAFGTAEALERTLEQIRNDVIEPFQVVEGENRIAIVTNWRAIEQFKNEGRDPKTGEWEYLKRIAREQDLSVSQVASEHELIFNSDKSAGAFEFTQVMQSQRGGWEDPDPNGVYFAAVDGSGLPKPGSKGDYTVLIILRKTDEGLKAVQLYRKRGISFERRYKEICELLNMYEPILTYVESNDGLGQTYLENLSSGCPSLDLERFNQNNQRKGWIVNKIQLGLERGDLSIPKSAVIDELLSFQIFSDGTMGAVGKDAHDDTVMGLGMALAAARY